jgi:hypothetical protein
LEGNVFDILPKDIKNFTLQRISKTLPSKGYQKLYLPKDIKNVTLQRISKTLPSILSIAREITPIILKSNQECTKGLLLNGF